ncbi:MAG: hypothetical protein GXO80_05235 [Chlorobi bacterium]|nr:hypothetical protein [Chlorobiota bacterium]
MSQKIIPIEYDKFYHIYNQAVSRENLFREKANYEYFLKQYDKYIEPIAETFAWCLMPNHFHILVRIKEENEIDRMNLPITVRVVNPDSDYSNIKIKQPSKYFSDLFNSYTQAYNKKYNRSGTLFKRPFRRIWVDNEKYYKNLVIYIHNNPVHHGFMESIIEYPWTSYLTVCSERPTKLLRKEVLNWFGDIDNFVFLHKNEDNNNGIEKYLID